MALNEILSSTNVSLTGNVSPGFYTSELTTLADGSFVLAYVDLVDGSEVVWTIFTSEGAPVFTGGTPASRTNREADPDIVALSGGGFALTWSATRDDVIFAAVYDENGGALVAPFGASDGFSSNWPRVAALSNDVYALTWYQVTTVTVDGSPVSNFEIYTAVYDAQGDEIAAPVVVSVADGVSDVTPKIAVLSNGDYALTWTKVPSDGIPEIYTVVYTALGVPVAAATSVGAGANVQIAALEDGGYALTWVTSEVMTAVFDNTGVQVSASVVVASGVETLIAALENGNYALFWSDGVDAWTAVYNDQGEQVSAPVNVTIANPLIDYASDIQVLSNGAYALTWTGETEPGSVGSPGTTDIFVAVYDAQGQEAIAPVNVSNTPGLYDTASDLTALADGAFAVAWQGGVDGAFLGDQFMAVYQFAPTQPPNEPPTAATTNSVVTDEDTASTAVPIGAADADGDVLSYVVKTGFEPTTGTVSFAAGSFVYTPGANANGTDSFTILIDDGHGGTAEQAVTVTINPRNDPAIIGGTVLRSVDEDGGAGEIATGQLTITDVDGTAEQVFQAGVIVGDYGSLTVTASGSWTYVLDNDNADVQALDTGGALTDTIVVQSIDGTAKDIVVTIKGADEESPNTVRYYLLIDGIDGGSRAEGHEGWFEISDYDFDLTNPVTIGSVTGGAGVGRLEFPPLTVTLGLGLGQADLFEMIARGLHLTGVRFEGVTADGERVFDLTLGTVFLTDLEDRGSGLDTLTMGYGQAWLETYTQTDSGEGPVQRYAWDQVGNREITDPPPELQPGSARGEAATPVRYYLLLDGIDGGSTAEGHKGWFEISDYDFDLTSPGTTISLAGKLQFAPLTVTLGLGLGETDLFEMIARGLHFTGVRIEGVTADGERAFDLTLGTVFLSQIEDRGGERDTLTMVYGQAWLETYTQIEPGVAGPVQRYAWDQLTNKAITEPPPVLSPSNIAPTADATNTVVTDEDTASGQVEIGATDADGGTLAYGVKEGSEPERGSVAFVGGSFVYTPDTNANGADSFTILIGDGQGGTAEQVVTVTINPVNDAPTAAAGNAVITDEDTISSAVPIGAADVDADPLSYSVKTGFGPAKGSLAFVGGSFVYTPKADANGPDSFTILINDGKGGTAEQIVTVTIKPVNDAPTAPTGNTGVLAEDAAPLVVPIGAADVDGDVLTYTVKAGTEPVKGLVTFSGGSFVYTPFANANGSDRFTILINDGASAILEQTVAITINPVNDAAVIVGTKTGSVTEDSGAGQIASGQLFVSDVDGAAEAAFQAGTIVAAGGFLTISESGAWSYELDNIIPAVQRLNAGETLTDTVTVRTVDGTTAAIVITIHGTDEPISNGDATGPVDGTAGNDLIDAQGGTDIIHAGAGNDIVLAGDGIDVVFGGDGNDTITGGEGRDLVHGDDGDDRFIATPGDDNDTYLGGDGIDTLDFSAFTSSVEVALGGGRSAGFVAGTQTGDDMISSIENVIGGSGNDNLRGSGGDNRLEGGAGDDFLYGSGGNDILIGGLGDDTLLGSGHNDVFVFGPGFGRDTVGDYDDNARGSQDVLDISAFGITFDDFFERVTITDLGNDTRITIDGNSDQRILLEGITNATRITIDDFLLA